MRDWMNRSSQEHRRAGWDLRGWGVMCLDHTGLSTSRSELDDMRMHLSLFLVFFTAVRESRECVTHA